MTRRYPRSNRAIVLPAIYTHLRFYIHISYVRNGNSLLRGFLQMALEVLFPINRDRYEGTLYISVSSRLLTGSVHRWIPEPPEPCG